MPIVINQLYDFSTSTWLPKSVTITLLALFSWWLTDTVNILSQREVISFDNYKADIQHSDNSKLPGLYSKNLFGEVDSATQKEASPAPAATKLPLILRGILATDDPTQGFAQIQLNDDEQYFIVSDKIFGIATLEEIYIDRVIINRNGNLETLMLPDEFLNAAHFETARRKQEMKKVASTYRDVFLSRDGMELIKLFGFKTAWKNGGFVGFIVTALGDPGREMMKTLGVEDGDLITVVNGKRFSESLEAAQSLTELKTATSFDVIIERNGAEIPMHFEMDTPVDKYANLPDGVTKDDVIEAEILATPTWDEDPGTAEIKRIQRERTTGKRDAVEFDH